MDGSNIAHRFIYLDVDEAKIKVGKKYETIRDDHTTFSIQEDGDHYLFSCNFIGGSKSGKSFLINSLCEHNDHSLHDTKNDGLEVHAYFRKMKLIDGDKNPQQLLFMETLTEISDQDPSFSSFLYPFVDVVVSVVDLVPYDHESIISNLLDYAQSSKSVDKFTRPSLIFVFNMVSPEDRLKFEEIFKPDLLASLRDFYTNPTIVYIPHKDHNSALFSSQLSLLHQALHNNLLENHKIKKRDGTLRKKDRMLESIIQASLESSIDKSLSSFVDKNINKRIKRLPKAELHIHLTGAYPYDFLCSIATEHEILALNKAIEILAKGLPYQDSFQCFLPVEKIMNTNERVESGTEALVKHLHSERVVYVEIRSGLKNFAGKGYEEYLQSVLRGIAKGSASVHGQILVKLLLSVRRNSSRELAEETVNLAIKYKEHVVGIDISGNSMQGDMSGVIEQVKRAKKEGLFVALHMGEIEEEMLGDKENEQIQILNAIQPDRIGHGVFLTKDTEQWIYERQIPIEVCPSSSVLAGMVKHHSEHPRLEHEHIITIGSDDPLLFQTDLTREYQKVHSIGKFSFGSIRRMISRSFQYSFMSREERLRLKQRYPEIDFDLL
eukprot:TRINITY_DN6325_c0_g2_i1.p1 TRINITY_DN6325_c0_g2~~TRINITY_DN6325_c0_g2_i1.p1  ORF type:complete len:607 (-),score=76.93 TRINITY_DN6325_c0_g2_i1:18-1838(-)